MNHLQRNALEKYSNHIDQVLISPRITEQETINGCNIAMDFKVTNVWVKPCYVHRIMNIFHNACLNVGTFIGYPFGINTTHVKLSEAKRALSEGVNSLALSINEGDLISGKSEAILEEIKCVNGLAHMNGAQCFILINFQTLERSRVIFEIELGIKANADGIILQADFTQDLMTINPTEVPNVTKLGDITRCIHLPDKAPIEELGTIFQYDYDRVGITIR